MIVIRSRLSLFLCFAIIVTAIIPARGIFAADKDLSLMPNSDTLVGWKLRGPTSGALENGEFAKGPLMLQGGMGAVAYRNIRISVLGQ